MQSRSKKRSLMLGDGCASSTNRDLVQQTEVLAFGPEAETAFEQQLEASDIALCKLP